MSNNYGRLYIVSTPIGNLEDITLRAIRTLKEVDFIAAEDTRHSRKLLNHYGITKPLISYWSEKEKIRSKEIMEKLCSGLSVAIISDAGTPGISDPGAVLIKGAIDKGIDVIPIPGVSALIAALSVSGISTEEFTFIGFLPAKAAQRQKKLNELVFEQRALIFYEAPHRILETLRDMEEIFGSRYIVLAKEITKIHEEILRGTIPEIIDMLETKTIAGEYVIIAEGSKREKIQVDEALKEIKSLMKKGKGRKEAVKIVAGQYGLSKKELYDKSLES
ncbi:ribosomal RNA small subunit methyltransferase I [Dissulfurispira thermophila]|uniref:Ribosomal RNA small subunit methyltransferase I n=1 Tax=Dissulfurispira thermophila TaxID=2715679 RepID=A0A7G1H3D1_9BACT|nr:16S rRNA (cytidine(1402)-2'-O)-methyltransferase [Dissulfurispira thermophila]BCB96623.1 ribosomal RNA small subunit methyltransferase I [Dissulfurispira thermophila]